MVMIPNVIAYAPITYNSASAEIRASRGQNAAAFHGG
jgi:hypothetical protein